MNGVKSKDSLTYCASSGLLIFQSKADSSELRLLTSKSEAGDIIDMVIHNDLSVCLLKNGVILASIKNPFSHLTTNQQSEFRAGSAIGLKARDVSIYCYVVLRGESTAVRFYDLFNLQSQPHSFPSESHLPKLLGKSYFQQKILKSKHQINNLISAAFQGDNLLLRKNLAAFKGFVTHLSGAPQGTLVASEIDSQKNYIFETYKR